MNRRPISLMLVLPNTLPTKHCVVKPFYLIGSNSDGYSVNFRCVDASSFANVLVNDFDGKNREQNAGTSVGSES